MKLKSILFLSAISLSTLTFAQQVYFVETLQEPYQDLQGSTIISDSLGWDDPTIQLDIPFAFSMGGNALDSMYVMDGGLSSHDFFMDLDAPDQDFLGLSSIVAMGSDLIDRGVLNGGLSTSPISYKSYVENGKNILAVEFKNAGFIDEDVLTGASTDFVNFQMRLVDDNSIEFHFGDSHITTGSEYFDNNIGNVVALMPNYDVMEIGNIVFNTDMHALADDPSNPTVELINDMFQLFNGMPGFDTYPESGTKYIFSLNSPNIGQSEWDNSGISIANPIEQTLLYSNNQNKVDYIEIVDLQGKLVLSTSAIENIDVSTLEAGMYMVKFYKGNKTQSVQKMVKS